MHRNSALHLRFKLEFNYVRICLTLIILENIEFASILLFLSANSDHNECTPLTCVILL